MQKPRSNSGPAGVAAPPATRARHPVEPPSTSLVSSPLVYTRESSSGPDRWLQLSFAGSPLDGAVSEHPELPTYRAPCMPIRPPCFQEGSHSRARPQRGGVMTPKSGVMFLKNSPLCRGHVSENGVGNVSEKHALKWGHDPDKSHIGFRPKSGVTEPLGGPLNLDFCTNAPGGPSWTKHTSRLYPLPVLNPTLR